MKQRPNSKSKQGIIAQAKKNGIRRAKDATAALVKKANKNRAQFAFYVFTNILVLLSYAFTLYKLKDPKGTITVRDINEKSHKVKTADITRWDKNFLYIAAFVLALGLAATIGFIVYASNH